jgi:hypothetical protein
MQPQYVLFLEQTWVLAPITMSRIPAYLLNFNMYLFCLWNKAV